MPRSASVVIDLCLIGLVAFVAYSGYVAFLKPAETGPTISPRPATFVAPSPSAKALEPTAVTDKPPNIASTSGPKAQALYEDENSQLISFDLDSDEKRVLLTGKIHFCEYEPGNDAVWVLVERPDFEGLGLLGLDGHFTPLVHLNGGERAETVAVRPSKSVLIGALGMLATSPNLLFDFPKGKSVPLNNCYGDASWYCYTNANDEDPGGERTLNEEFKQSMDLLSKGRFESGPHVESILGRARATRESSSGDGSARPPECTNDAWSVVATFQGTSLKLVMTGIEFGDFAHPAYQLLDSDKNEYFLPQDPRGRSKTASAEGAWEVQSLFVSPGARYLMEYGHIYSLETQRDVAIARPCGFVGKDASVVRLHDDPPPD